MVAGAWGKRVGESHGFLSSTLGEPPLEKNQRIQSRRGFFFFFFFLKKTSYLGGRCLGV